MTKQDEILNATIDNNVALSQLSKNIETLVSTISKQQENPAEKPQKIGFIQNAVKGIIDNPKTSIAGISTFLIGISEAFFPEYSGLLQNCLVGVSGGGLLLARDAKPAPAPAPNDELLG